MNRNNLVDVYILPGLIISSKVFKILLQSNNNNIFLFLFWEFLFALKLGARKRRTDLTLFV